MENRILPPVSEETKRKTSINITEYNKSDKHRKKVSSMFKGIPKTEEQKRKQSTTMLIKAARGENNAMASEINRKKVSESKMGFKSLYKEGIRKMAKPNLLNLEFHQLFNYLFSTIKSMFKYKIILEI